MQLKSPKFLPGTALNGPFSSTMAMNGCRQMEQVELSRFRPLSRGLYVSSR